MVVAQTRRPGTFRLRLDCALLPHLRHSHHLRHLAVELIDGACAWGRQVSWRVLEVAAQAATGNCQSPFLNLKAVAARWYSAATRPHLHYVVVLGRLDSAQVIQLLQDLQPKLPMPGLQGGEALHSGFHRYELAAGQLLLTLCVGDRKTQLRQLQFDADAMLLATPSPSWDRWHSAALALCAAPGTSLTAIGLDAEPLSLLSNEGFVWQPPDPVTRFQCAQFAPNWLRKGQRQWTRNTPRLAVQRMRDQLRRQAVGEPLHCAVVGAGLAGAATAYALARRGWRVTVLDAAPHAAAQASGLPVGLLGPASSNAPAHKASPLVRLSHAGVALTLQHAQRLLQEDRDWKASGLLTLKPGTPAKWQNQAAWIKPSALVSAWLAHPNIRFRGNTLLAGCDHQGTHWRLLDARGEMLVEAPLVVLATACNAQGLIAQTLKLCPQWQDQARQFSALQAMAGQVTWGPQTGALEAYLPAFPVNGVGHLLAHVPEDAGMQGVTANKFWLFGAGYEALDASTQDCAADGNHIRYQTDQNLSRLAQMLPGTASALRTHTQAEAPKTWRNLRAVSRDRLPMVGPVLAPESGLWTVGGFGSRGLTWAVLCAELLAAQLHGEPFPIESSLAAKLDLR